MSADIFQVMRRATTLKYAIRHTCKIEISVSTVNMKKFNNHYLWNIWNFNYKAFTNSSNSPKPFAAFDNKDSGKQLKLHAKICKYQNNDSIYQQFILIQNKSTWAAIDKKFTDKQWFKAELSWLTHLPYWKAKTWENK